MNQTHAPLITRARHRVHLESACMFLKAFLDTRLYIYSLSPLSSDFFIYLIPFLFSILRHCLGGRRTPIRRPSHRTCNRRDRDGGCTGYFVQGFLHWKMSVLVNGRMGGREGKWQLRPMLTNETALNWNENGIVAKL